MKYVLFMGSDMSTMEIVRFLNFMDVEAEPALCIDKNYPPKVKILPSIFDIQSKEWFEGLSRCIDFYQTKTGFKNIPDLARTFNREFS